MEELSERVQTILILHESSMLMIILRMEMMHVL